MVIIFPKFVNEAIIISILFCARILNPGHYFIMRIIWMQGFKMLRHLNINMLQLQRQKLSLDIERSTLILNHPCLLKECDDDSECEFDFVMEKETDL